MLIIVFVFSFLRSHGAFPELETSTETLEARHVFHQRKEVKVAQNHGQNLLISIFQEVIG
jgi:hypothetical protein